MRPIELGSLPLTLEDAQKVVFEHHPVTLCADALGRARRACQFLFEHAEAGHVIYGVTTGFGANAETVIDRADTRRLQSHLLMSHACGVGPAFDESVVRSMLLFRLASLITEHSGAQPATLQALATLLNQGAHPVVPSQGSVGASGDLCPLAHLCLPLIGLGDVVMDGHHISGAEALRRCGMEPIELTYKEGIALLNGTQAQSALAFVASRRLKRVLEVADAACAMSLEALCGRSSAFDERVHRLRNHAGQQRSAARIRRWIEGSELVNIDVSKVPTKRDKVQDPYCLRCAPQVHGACLGVLDHVEQVLSGEINAVTDNPILFPDAGDILSAGNFHGEPIAMVLDYLKLAVAEAANISDRRCFKLLSPSDNEGLPAFLVDDPGLNSGLMIAQYVTAALVSENKVLAHPASVDSIPTSANKEDHVAMGVQAGLQAMRMLDNTERVLAIELVISAQALDMRRAQIDAKPSPRTIGLHRQVRAHVDYLAEDRVVSGEFERVVRDLITAPVVLGGENPEDP